MLDAVIIGIVVITGTEIGLRFVVSWLRTSCPWLINAKDLDPEIDPEGLARFIEHGWDQELGWVRKPDTSRFEQGQGGVQTQYKIDATGAREDPGLEGAPAGAIACGDSYTFCRQVDDNETWPHFLSLELGSRVRNIGVGNYGIDQAVLRLEREFERFQAPIAIMGVVPETICRVRSVWKHFSEYGNTLAFKPRFTLQQNGELEVLPNPISKPEDFLRVKDLLPGLKSADSFYRDKFLPDLLRAPYLYHVVRTWRRTPLLMIYALADRLDGGKRAFTSVMRRNISIAAGLYKDPESRALLLAIVRRFSEVSRANGARPVLIFTPQLLDLQYLRSGDFFYADFLEDARGMVEVLDMGPFLASADADDKLYIDDRFGGHLSAAGNRMVADRLSELLHPPAASTGGAA